MTSPTRQAAIQAATDWFTARDWTAFPYQEAVWNAYLDGESGLIYTATGTGKTYAAWFGPLLDWLLAHPNGGPLQNAPPLRVLWITPLRALAADTESALAAPLADLGIPWTLETRTGDTSATVRSRQRRRLPTALVTTPESLSLLLAREDAAQLFAHLEAVIVDEWHELMATKRGVQTELALARLRRWRPGLRTWGLSATMGNLETAQATLLGVGRTGRLIHGSVHKPITIESIIPATMERFPWAGHLGLKLLPQVIEVVESGQTALIFTNTRSQTEAWYQALIDARPDWIGEIALHHGSLDKDVRDWVENGLRLGRLRCVVCTSSLDLGVDFAPVDHVLQVGSPKGAARLLQRTGRSGHRPGAESRVTCVPTHAFELVEVAAARAAVRAGHLEDRLPLEKPLDVLVQHIVTIALGGGFEPDVFYEEVRTSHAFRNLTPLEWAWALDFVTYGGPALQAYPAYARVNERDGRFVVDKTDVARTHRMSIGTIVSDAALTVQYIRGAQIGSIEESFAARLKPGDRFVLGGKVLEFVRLRDMKVWVRRASSRRGIIPRWYGGLMPLSSELTEAVRQKLDEARQGRYEDAEMRAVQPILELQRQVSVLPAPDDFLIERTRTREGHHLFFYPFEGRLVHEGLAALFAYRLAQLRPITFTIAVNDYGFELLSPEPAPLDDALANGLLSTERLADDILNSLAAGELARRQFREIARISGLIVSRFPGGQKTARQLQTSSGLLYDVFTKYDPDNLLLRQAQREVLERQLEASRLARTLARLAESNLVRAETRRPTPFAFPLLVEHFRQTLTSEKLADRVRKMQLSLERDFTTGRAKP
jgi:ATP-dependent Lhr-like helicase